MLSQSLLFWAWRDCAAPPDSSASSQAEMTDGSRPVLAARRAANCCWPEVSWLWAPAGRVALPVPEASPAAPIAAPVCWAWARASAKLVGVVDPVAVGLVPAAEGVVAAATDGLNAPWIEAIW